MYSIHCTLEGFHSFCHCWQVRCPNHPLPMHPLGACAFYVSLYLWKYMKYKDQCHTAPQHPHKRKTLLAFLLFFTFFFVCNARVSASSSFSSIKHKGSSSLSSLPYFFPFKKISHLQPTQKTLFLPFCSVHYDPIQRMHSPSSRTLLKIWYQHFLKTSQTSLSTFKNNLSNISILPLQLRELLKIKRKFLLVRCPISWGFFSTVRSAVHGASFNEKLMKVSLDLDLLLFRIFRAVQTHM